MKKALIISTGGTIVSLDKGDGAKPDESAARNISAEAQACLEEKGYACEFDMIFGAAGLDSSDMTPERWVALTNRIYEAAADGVTKVLIIHGTDTMAYTAAWLELTTDGKTAVVLTGSQRTPDAADFDGWENVRGAAGLLAEKKCGVFIYFDGKAFPGAYVHKANAEALDAYRLSSDKADLLRSHEDINRAKLYSIKEARGAVSVLYIYPGAEPIFSETSEILVIMGYGAGNMPQSIHREIIKFYEEHEADEDGIISPKPVVIAASSCYAGEKKPGYYGGVGIAGLSEHGFIVFGQGGHSAEFITALAYLALYMEPSAPEKILARYLEKFCSSAKQQ